MKPQTLKNNSYRHPVTADSLPLHKDFLSTQYEILLCQTVANVEDQYQNQMVEFSKFGCNNSAFWLVNKIKLAATKREFSCTLSAGRCDPRHIWYKHFLTLFLKNFITNYPNNGCLINWKGSKLLTKDSSTTCVPGLIIL